MKNYYFEVSFAPKGSKARWIRPEQPKSRNFLEAQGAAIANGERPYRVKTENIPDNAPKEAATS